MQPTLFLEDLFVGQRFSSEPYALSKQQIIEFATDFDPQVFHLDEIAAQDTFFNGLAASGWHTGAITMRLLVASIPFGNGLIGAGVEIAWPRPTRPDDILQVDSEILAIRHSQSKPDRGIVTLSAETRNQHGDLLQTLKTNVIAFRKEPLPV